MDKLLCELVEIKYFDVNYDNFVVFVQKVYNLPKVKFGWIVEEDMRENTYEAKREPLEPRWEDELHKFTTTGEGKDVTDVISLILHDLCNRGHLKPGEYRFNSV